MIPTGQQVADFLGRGDDTALVALAGAHLPVVVEMVRAYTRGAGFFGGLATDPDPPLKAVIVSATARSATNPAGTRQESVGAFSVSPGIFNGWTLPELAILNSYRRRAV